MQRGCGLPAGLGSLRPQRQSCRCPGAVGSLEGHGAACDELHCHHRWLAGLLWRTGSQRSPLAHAHHRGSSSGNGHHGAMDRSTAEPPSLALHPLQQVLRSPGQHHCQLPGAGRQRRGQVPAPAAPRAAHRVAWPSGLGGIHQHHVAPPVSDGQRCKPVRRSRAAPAREPALSDSAYLVGLRSNVRPPGPVGELRRKGRSWPVAPAHKAGVVCDCARGIVDERERAKRACRRHRSLDAGGHADARNWPGFPDGALAAAAHAHVGPSGIRRWHACRISAISRRV
mmetsp:Transcript_2265/g.8748  ORF Transcript_2265/g.8748 Transcript_2265/m.8748 type:complete len:283 (-) Transcript_2265:1607-2455(-)